MTGQHSVFSRLWLLPLGMLLVVGIGWTAAPPSQAYAGGSPLVERWVWVALENASKHQLNYADSWEDGAYDSSLVGCAPGVGFDQPSFTLGSNVRAACQFTGDLLGGGHGTGNLSVAGDASAWLYWDFNVHYAETNDWYCSLTGDAPKILQLQQNVQYDSLGDTIMGKIPSLTCLVAPGEHVGAIATGVAVDEVGNRDADMRAVVRIVPNVPTADRTVRARVTLKAPGAGRVGSGVTLLRDGSPKRVTIPLDETFASRLAHGRSVRATVKVEPLTTGTVRRDVDRVRLNADGVYRQSR